MKKVVDRCNKMEFSSLNELFEAWKNAQINEIEWENTFPKKYENGQPIIPPEEFKGSFCVDGFLSDKFNGVLFILKESNTDGEYKGTFWFKDCENQKGWKKYKNALEFYLKKLSLNDESYKNCAYMNLNKRGGYGRCDENQLGEYVKKYKHFIANEIEIIKPTYIVCCGANIIFELIKEIITEYKIKGITLYDGYHPAYPSYRKKEWIRTETLN